VTAQILQLHTHTQREVVHTISKTQMYWILQSLVSLSLTLRAESWRSLPISLNFQLSVTPLKSSQFCWVVCMFQFFKLN
jgi:protein gp37